MKYLEKKQINIDSLRKSYKELIRNNNSILKAQQRFKSERHKCFYWRKLIKLLWLQMMIKEFNQLIRWEQMPMERAKIRSVKKKRFNVTM